MSKRLMHSNWMPLLLSSVFIVFSFQNCSPVQFEFQESRLASQDPGGSGLPVTPVDPGNPTDPILTCTFNSQIYQEGAQVTAYELVNGTCQSETRICRSGNFTGSYRFANCVPTSVQQSCTFNGMTVPHGQSVIAYASSSVPAGSNCSSQSRTCNNGVLSGSYSYASCNVQSPVAQAPTFSCTKASYNCGEIIRCSASGSDINLKACDSYGCYPLLGRADWTYLGNGNFSYARLNDNGGTSEGQYWGVQDSNGLRSPMQHYTTRSCAPTFSCTKPHYACGETVSCSATGTDANLQACSPEGCFPLMGRANWTYIGNGSFSYSWVNRNENTSLVGVTWFSKNSNGYISSQSYYSFGACR